MIGILIQSQASYARWHGVLCLPEEPTIRFEVSETSNTSDIIMKTALLLLPLLAVQASAADKPKPDAEQVKRGQAIYARTCIACHQPTGMGLPPVFPPLAGSEWVAKGTSVAVRNILHGMQGPVTVKGVTYNSMMPPVMGLKDAEIADVVTYVANSFGNAAGVATEADVKAIREKYKDRKTPWTAAELEKPE